MSIGLALFVVVATSAVPASKTCHDETEPALACADEVVRDDARPDVLAETPPAVTPVASASEPEIVVQARRRAVPGDPLASINARSFAVAQDVDRAIVGPAALAYQRTIPDPIRSGLRNFVNNTREPVVFLSFLLEFKPGKAGETLGRFVINTILGLAGIMDVAKRQPFHLPRRPNGLADVMGYHGIHPGPYFFLPLIGPTTLRDAIGGGLDRLVLPTALGAPFNHLSYAIGTGAISALDRRVAFDDTLETVRDTTNPYAVRRQLYLAARQSEIDGLHTPGWNKPRREDETTRAD